MTSDIIESLNRAKDDRNIRRKYFMIYEGECTEPDYFAGICRHRKDLGISDLIELNNISKPEIEWSQTDIEELIEITQSYIRSVEKHGFHVRYYLNQTFNEFCSRDRNGYREVYLRSEYRDECNIYEKHLIDDIRPIRDELERMIIESGLVDDDGMILDVPAVRKMCKETIETKLHFSTEHIYLKDVMTTTIREGDVICIVHDRDFSDEHFDDAKYLSALRTVSELNANTDKEYRLIITYPKFEFWLLLHSPDPKFNVKQMTKYPEAGNYCQRIFENTFVSYLSPNFKKIDEDAFDQAFSENIDTAIERSKKYCTDEDGLMSNLGTNVGILLEEMMRRD